MEYIHLKVSRYTINDNLHTLARPWEAIDQKIADVMSGYWANFAKTGNPNGDNLPKWNPYNKIDEKVMILDDITEQRVLPDKDKLSFWEKYYRSLDKK